MPIPHDKALSTLRATLDRALSKAEEKPSESGAPVLASALKQRETFDNLVSTTPQMDAYRGRFGVDWNERFTPVTTFAKQSFFGYEGKALVEHLWRQLPNSRFKRFQEMFCEPADYAIPKPNLAAPCVAYPTREDLNRCSLTGCLVSPARVPFKLLVDLGIVPEPDRKLTDLEALAIKSAPATIQSLKAVFESTGQLAPNNNRLAVVNPLNQTASRYYAEAKTIPEGVVGSLIYTRENVAIDRSTARSQRAPWTAPQRIPAFFSNIYSARRKTDHQTSTYQLETTTIGHLALEWNELTTRAREEWRRNASQEVKQEIRGALVRLVARTREELSSVTHHLKQQAAGSFEGLETRLRSGSNNITTHITSANAAVTRLERQLATVPYKSGHNTVDRDQLSRVIKDGEHAFGLIRNSLFAAGSRLRDEINRKGGFFKQRELSDEQRSAQATVILSRMKIPAGALNRVAPVRPLRAFEMAHRSAYTQLQNAVMMQNAQRAREAMVKLVVYAKLQHANAIFELLRALTGRSEAVPLKELRAHASALRGLLEAQSPFPYATVPEFQEVYQKLRKTVSIIAKGLEGYERKGLDLDERSQMYSRLRAYLDKTDLEAYTNSLVALDSDKE